MTTIPRNYGGGSPFGVTVDLDARDQEILAQRVAILAGRHEDPIVGDFVRMLDGTLRRFTHRWSEGLQTTVPTLREGAEPGGSFYLGHGYVSYSGSLDSTVPLTQLELTNETRPGWVWFFHHDHHTAFFHHDHHTAHNGVDVPVEFRVYRQVGRP